MERGVDGGNDARHWRWLGFVLWNLDLEKRYFGFGETV